MILLGITGPIGHGKSTLADFFAQAEPDAIHLESSQLIAEVANELNKHYTLAMPQPDDLVSTNFWLSHLPPIIAKRTHFQMFNSVALTEEAVTNDPTCFAKLWEYISLCHSDPSLLDQPITTVNKGEYRSILQWLGSYGERYIQSGLWYTELVHRAKSSNKSLAIIGGVRFVSDARAIQSAGGIVVAIERLNLTEQDLDDPTESERRKILNSTIIVNNGSLEQLYQCAKTILKDIKINQIQKQYNTNKL